MNALVIQPGGSLRRSEVPDPEHHVGKLVPEVGE